MYLQRTSGCTKQNSLQEQTELEALGENIKIILTFSYLAVPKQSFILLIFIHSVYSVTLWMVPHHTDCLWCCIWSPCATLGPIAVLSYESKDHLPKGIPVIIFMHAYCNLVPTTPLLLPGYSLFILVLSPNRMNQWAGFPPSHHSIA